MGQVTVDTFRIALIRATDSLGWTELRFAPVLHSGNQHESPEEVEKVAKANLVRPVNFDHRLPLIAAPSCLEQKLELRNIVALNDSLFWSG